jgi:phosphoribosylanthranilate isomerase
MMLAPNTVKICSLRQPEHAEWVIEAGADMFGLIFADSKRRVSPDDARAIVRRADQVSTVRRPLAVGVFVDQPADEINRVADRVQLDVIQHHRPELLVNAGVIERPVVLAFRTAPSVTADQILAMAEAAQDAGVRVAGVLIDGYTAKLQGGAGVIANWIIAAAVAQRLPVMLAGGLHPANVAAGISAVHPYAVDVSSGVETDGIKDRSKIVAFVQVAREGFASLLGHVDELPLGQTAEPVKGS